jgi:hypothetical protein
VQLDDIDGHAARLLTHDRVERGCLRTLPEP